jgi:hypothetical protein
MKDSTRDMLLKAAERIGYNNGQAQIAEWLKTHKTLKGFRPCPSEIHIRIIDALNRDIDDESAAALLWTYEGMRERLN